MRAVFCEPPKIYHGLSFSFFRLFLSFSFAKEKERNGHPIHYEYKKKNINIYAKYYGSAK